MSSTITTGNLSEEAITKQENTEAKTCINCGRVVSENYCGNCGQPMNVKRVTIKTLARDVYERLFGFDNKFSRTVIYLIRNPKEVVSEVIKGNRVRFFGAAGMYFLLLTIYLLLMQMLGITFDEIARPAQEAFTNPDVTEKQMAFGNKINNMIFSNFRIFGFVMIPFFSLANLILYRKARLNIVEHTIPVFYAFSLGMVVNIFSILFYSLTGYNSQMLLLILNLVIFSHVITGFYNNKYFPGFFKGFLSYFLGYIFFMLTVMVILIIMVIIDPSIAGL